MSFSRVAVAAHISGFCLATNLFGFGLGSGNGEARAESIDAAPIGAGTAPFESTLPGSPPAESRLPGLDDDSSELTPRPKPNCPSGSGKWQCSAKGVLHDTTAGQATCPGVGNYITGPTVRGHSQAAACTNAKHALNNFSVPSGCYPKHVKCKCQGR